MRKCKNYQHQKKGFYRFCVIKSIILINLNIYMKCTNPQENTRYTNTQSVLTKCSKVAGGICLQTVQKRQAECLYSTISNLHNESCGQWPQTTNYSRSFNHLYFSTYCSLCHSLHLSPFLPFQILHMLEESTVLIS